MRPTNPLVLFFAYFAVCGFGAAIVAYPLWWLTGYPFDKVLSRAAILLAVVLLVPLWRRLQLDARTIGYRAVPLWRVILVWFVGCLLITPPAWYFLEIGFRVADPRVPDAIAEALRVAGISLVSGALVGLIEESVFRGVLLTAWRRWHAVTAVAGSSFVYAMVHFIEPGELTGEPDWRSGVEHLVGAFRPLLNPVEYWDSFAALFLLGVGLCWVRLATGSLWYGIALHASWVTFLRIYKDLTVRDVVHPQVWIVGTYDNFVGELVAAWLLLLLAVAAVWQFLRRRQVA